MYFLHFQSMEDNPLIWLFVWAVIIDIVTGFAKSLVTKRTTSTKGIAGLIKHGVLTLVILTLYPMLEVNEMRSAGDTFVSFYILYYAVSILENWGQMGLPLPNWVKPYIYKLSDDYREGKDNNEHEHDH
nr:MAG TPA: holin [Caudoviricetes sp.]